MRLTVQGRPAILAVDRSHPSSERLPAIDLAAAWDALPPPSSLDSIRLEPLSNQLSMVELRRVVHRAGVLLAPGGVLTMVLRDPDLNGFPEPAPWPGEPLAFSGETNGEDAAESIREVYRPLRHFVELLRLFPFECPVPRGLAGHPTLLQIDARRHRTRSELEARDPLLGPPLDRGSIEARYGSDSSYRRFDRLEEPEIVDDLLYAWSRLAPARASRILALGVNDGRELDLVSEFLRPEPGLGGGPELWGIDASESAIDGARARFPDHAARFLAADLGDLRSLDLPRFPIVIALGVLQSTTVDRDRLLADLKEHLEPEARVLFSIPDCHFESYDILRRPLRRDDPRADRSLVAKDVRFLARWCHRAGFERVETFGSYDAFVLALRGGSGGGTASVT